MKAFFKNLDRIAERWLNTLDGELHEPVVRAITGEVFTQGTLQRQAPVHAQHVRTDIDIDLPNDVCDGVVADILNPALPMPCTPASGVSLLVT
jgi:hypothetical protein